MGHLYLAAGNKGSTTGTWEHLAWDEAVESSITGFADDTKQGPVGVLQGCHPEGPGQGGQMGHEIQQKVLHLGAREQ